MEWNNHTPPGTPPSTLIAPDEAHVPESFHVFRYTADAVEETELDDVAKLADLRKREGVTWVNFDGLGNLEMVRALGALLDLHPLALEDVLHTRQRPKADDYESNIFVVLRMLHFENGVETEQVSMFLGSDYVVTFQEHPGDCLDPIRERLRKGTGQLRRQGADFLMYAIIDTIIDNYFPFLEQVGEVVEELEDEVVENPTRQTLGRVHEIKRGLLDVRRSIWPLRDAVNTLIRDESALLGKTARTYLRDCYDHTIHVLDVVETYRELAGGLMDVYLSSVSNKMNEVMKVLTIIATIFIPLTFIAGVYGMNFEKMPELRSAWGYPVVWIVMVVVAVIMLVNFRRKGWLGGDKRE
ncbi:MAG TPA: magnesium/cobalt transporter CorA [Planctomycetota bacterium]|nr:magnesium/cobalt transporter CorA [Planctomycetota bacterium]